MKDIELRFENKPGQLALMGETLGRNGISLEGGGVFQCGKFSIGHFLVEDGEKAKEVLRAVGIEVVKIHEVVIQKLRQGEPGQLGKFSTRLANAKFKNLIQNS